MTSESKKWDFEVRLGDSEDEPNHVRVRDPLTGLLSGWIEQEDYVKRIKGTPGYQEKVKTINDKVKAAKEERYSKTPVPAAVRLTLVEKTDRLKEYLKAHPKTRLMDLEFHTDVERGPLFILAKKLLERGELFEHPKTKALSFDNVTFTKAEEFAEMGMDIKVRMLKDVPRFKDSEGKDRSLAKGEVVELPDSTARAIIKNRAAEEVLDIAPAPEDVPTATATPPADDPIKLNVLELSSSGPAGISGECEVPPVPQAILEAESINRLRVISRQQGEEAAIAAKREEEAPRIAEKELKDGEVRAADEELLRSGAWWDVVDAAIDEFLAGEPQLRKIIVYSALSAGVRGTRLHLMAIGDSQVGKSYALRSIGSKLFPDLFIDLAAMSAKALYYAADEANNPRLFDGKILFLDELADQGDGTLDFLKAAMSNGTEKLTSITVDEHRKSKTQALEGLPTIWSTSAEVLEDTEGQIMNRPFVVNPDESAEQTNKILDFQRDAVSVGLIRVIDSNIPRARQLLARILEEKEIIVYNLFSRHIKISADDARARNTLPMYFNLVAAIAYAHRCARPVIELPDGRKLLFANWQDIVEAAELWGWASGPKSTGLPNRLIELLNILPFFAGEITGGMELDDIVEAYKSKTGRKVGHKTILNYLSQLSSKDKASYFEREDENGKKHHLWYSTSSSHTFSTRSQLLIGIESKEGNRLLDDALSSLEDVSSQLPNEIRISKAGLREELLKDARGP